MVTVVLVDVEVAAVVVGLVIKIRDPATKSSPNQQRAGLIVKHSCQTFWGLGEGAGKCL